MIQCDLHRHYFDIDTTKSTMNNTGGPQSNAIKYKFMTRIWSLLCLQMLSHMVLDNKWGKGWVRSVYFRVFCNGGKVVTQSFRKTDVFRRHHSKMNYVLKVKVLSKTILKYMFYNVFLPPLFVFWEIIYIDCSLKKKIEKRKINLSMPSKKHFT